LFLSFLSHGDAKKTNKEGCFRVHFKPARASGDALGRMKMLRLSNKTQTHAGNLRISTVISSHAACTSITTRTRLTWTCPPPTHTHTLLFPRAPPLPVQWCDVSFFCGGLLTTGPDNQRVCKCQCVIFNSLFMVRVIKEDIFMVIVAGLFYYTFM